jgi:hypothetical protein
MRVGQLKTPNTRGCRRCPFRAPSRRCLDPAIKSGRCDDWVWYLWRNQQRRHVYFKPADPRTSKQRRWRARFGAVSRKYSKSLTDEQQDAFGSAATGEGDAIYMGTLPEYSLGNAVARSLELGHFPSLREGERPREPKHLPTSGKSGLARTLAIPAEIALAWPRRPLRSRLAAATAGGCERTVAAGAGCCPSRNDSTAKALLCFQP